MAKTEREFLDRSLSSQDAIYAKLVCEKCSRNGAIPMFEVLEYEEDGRTYFVCTCQKCGTSCTVDLRASAERAATAEEAATSEGPADPASPAIPENAQAADDAEAAGDAATV